MNAGRLSRRVRIQTPATGTDALGQPLEGWTDLASVWADIRHKTGAESIRGGADVSVVQVSIRIRYRTGVQPAMRVLHGTTVYEIRAVLPDEIGREHLDLVCEVIQ